jgi:hypothetical protein
MKALIAALGFLITTTSTGFAADELVAVTGGETFNYILATRSPGAIAYGVILMPGGPGRVNPHMEGSKLVLAGSGNFLIRSREIFADQRFVAASTDATSSPERIQAIMGDLRKRYGNLAIYVIGTSKSTISSMSLAKSLDGQAAGFIHTSSMSAISSFDTRASKSRNLIVLHKMDACRVTNPSAGISAHNKYGIDLIEMDGGKSSGDDCEAYAYHGYSGIEQDTVARIKAWIAAGK